MILENKQQLDGLNALIQKRTGELQNEDPECSNWIGQALKCQHSIEQLANLLEDTSLPSPPVTIRVNQPDSDKADHEPIT